MAIGKLTDAQYRALSAAARGEVYRTDNGSVFVLTGPGGSKTIRGLIRAGLIVNPPNAKKPSRYRMMVTEGGQAALVLATFERNRER
jgi:DNA-binding MarR family transcriptional regulator